MSQAASRSFLPRHAMLRPIPHLRALCALSALLAGPSASCFEEVPQGPWPEYAQMTLLNRTRELVQLTAYPVRASVDLGCELVVGRPGLLTEGVFDLSTPLPLPLLSGEEISVNPQDWDVGFYSSRGDCDAVLLRGAPAGDVVIVWERAYGGVAYVRDSDAPEHLLPSGQSVVLEADYDSSPADQLHAWRERPCPSARPGDLSGCTPAEIAEAARVPTGARYRWTSRVAQSAHARLRSPSPADDPSCPVQTPGCRLEWGSAPSDGVWEVVARQTPRSGCARFTLEQVEAPEGARITTEWEVCAPEEMIRPLWPEDGTRAQARFLDATSGDAQLLQATITALSADGVLLRSPRHLELARGAPSAASRVEWYTREATPEHCGTTQATACGVPLRARLLHARLSMGASTSQPAALGRPLLLRASRRRATVMLLRGGQVPWVDLGCAREGASVFNAGGPYIEAVALIEE